MEWLMSGGELLAGVVLLVLWWLALKVLGGNETKRLTNTRFVILPCIFLLWLVGGLILVLQGLRVI
jgi:hypothetical protein